MESFWSNFGTLLSVLLVIFLIISASLTFVIFVIGIFTNTDQETRSKKWFYQNDCFFGDVERLLEFLLFNKVISEDDFEVIKNRLRSGTTRLGEDTIFIAIGDTDD